jgi:hypothetical protein
MATGAIMPVAAVAAVWLVSTWGSAEAKTRMRSGRQTRRRARNDLEPGITTTQVTPAERRMNTRIMEKASIKAMKTRGKVRIRIRVASIKAISTARIMVLTEGLARDAD